MSTSRCVICNAVSSPELALVPSESKRQKFHTHPHNDIDMLCHDCFAEIANVQEEWASEDDADDWEDDEGLYR